MEEIKEAAAIAAQEVPTPQGEATGTQSSSQAAKINEGATSTVAGESNNTNINSKNSNAMSNSNLNSEVNSNVMDNSNKNERKNKTQAPQTSGNLKRSIEKEQKRLGKLEKQGASPIVLQAQQQVIDDLKAELEKVVAVKAPEPKLQSAFVNFELVDDETGAKEEVQKKIAFVENNRPIDAKKVAIFVSLTANRKYEKAYPVIAIKAQLLVFWGYAVKDITGRHISEEEAADYLVILDGQHRCMAFAQLIAAGQDLTIPNVRLREVENVGEYLTNINKVGNWKTYDKACIAALLNPEDKLLQAIADRLKEGFNYSSSCQIYTGKKLMTKALDNALEGKTYVLPKGAEINIERGNKFITLCQAAEMKTAFITKRYFIEGFNCHCISVGEEKAFKSIGET